MTIHYTIRELIPYINWDYFFYAWGMHMKPQAEKDGLRQEAETVLTEIEDKYTIYGL